MQENSNTEYSDKKLSDLLYSSGAIKLLPDEEREKMIARILAMKEQRKRNVFEELLKEIENIAAIENQYQGEMRTALDNYTAALKEGNAKVIREMKKQMEEKEIKKEKIVQEQLLKQLENA